MLVNRIGNTIGIRADRGEVDILADITPRRLRALALGFRACRMSETDTHIEVMSPAQVIAALSEARAQYPTMTADTLPDGASRRDHTAHRVIKDLKESLLDPSVVTETGL